MDLQVLIIYHEDLSLMYSSFVKLECQGVTAQQQQKVISKKTKRIEKNLYSSCFVSSPSKAGFAIKVLLYHL